MIFRVMLANELELIRNEIRAAFPAAEFYGPITSCDCEECSHLRDNLRQKRWNQVPTAFLDFTCSPTLLTPEAFQAFLPAYMLRGLDDLTGERVVLEFTIYSLCPDFPEQDGGLSQQIKDTRLHELAR